MNVTGGQTCALPIFPLRITFTFLSENVQQDRFLLCLQKLKCSDEQRYIVAINWSVVTQPELLKNDARYEQALDALFDFVCKLRDRFSRNRLDEMPRLVV